MVREWKDLPESIKNDYVQEYYKRLEVKKRDLLLKKIFDLIVASILLIVLSPMFLLIGIIIKLDSKGPIIFKQTRVTQYGEKFLIFKFRTMVSKADKSGEYLTIKNDSRVTRVGRILRRLRLDETPQLLNIIKGDMSFVGTRPEVVKYVEKYTDEMMATLLLPAGVTSEASIHYKDEELLLLNVVDAEDVYINKILPKKMEHNLRGIKEFSFLNEMKIIANTLVAILKRNKKGSTEMSIIDRNEANMQ